MVTELYWPTLPVRSGVFVTVGEVQAKSGQGPSRGLGRCCR